MQISNFTLLSDGNLQYTVTLDASDPSVSRDDFRAVFTGTYQNQYRVDWTVPDAITSFTGTGLTRTIVVTPPTQAHGQLTLFYAPDGDIDGEESAASNAYSILPETLRQTGPSGQQSQQCGPRGSQTRPVVLYRNASTTSPPSAGTGSVRYSGGTFRITNPSGWSNFVGAPGAGQSTYMQVAGYRINYSGPSLTNVDNIVWRRGCVQRLQTGPQGCRGLRAPRYVPFTFYLVRTTSLGAPSRPSRGSYSGSRNTASITGWTQTPPSSISDTQTLYSLQAWGITNYSSTGSLSSCSLCIGCVMQVPRGCQGCRGCAGTAGLRAPWYIPFTFYRVRTTSQGLPPYPSSGARSFNFRNQTASITNWSLTPPTSFNDNQQLYAIQAWGIIYFNNLGNAVSGALNTGCIRLIARGPSGTDGTDGDDGCDGLRAPVYRPFVFYTKTTSATAPRAISGTYSSRTPNTASITNPSSTWSLTPPTTVADNEYVWSVQAWGVTTFNTSGNVASASLSIGCVALHPRGCQGCDGDDGRNANCYVPFTFYLVRATSLGAPARPTSGSYSASRGTATITGWTSTPPTTISDTSSLYAVQAWGKTTYSATNVASTSLEIGCVYLIPRGCEGCQGCRGCPGLRAPTYIPFTFYQRSTTVPPRPTSGTYTGRGSTPASITNWSLTPPTTVSDSENIYSLQTWGVTTYTASGAVAARVLSIGCVSLVPKGCRGCAGEDGDDGQNANCYVPFTFYLVRASSLRAPDAPARGSYNATAGTASITGWTRTPPTTIADTNTLYALDTWGVVTYTSTGSIANCSLRIGCVRVVPRGAGGCQGCRGCAGRRGSDVKTFRLYARDNDEPSVTGIGYSTGGALTFTSSAGRIWKTTRGATSGTATEWYLDVTGYLNYAQDGTVSSSACLFGPYQLCGCPGAAGSDGARGTDVRTFRLYARSTSSPSTSGIGYNTSGSLTFTSSAGRIWKTTRGATSGTATEWYLDITGYRNYNAQGAVTSSSRCLFGPYQLLGCKGDQGSCGTNVKVFRLYARNTTAPSTAGIGYNASGSLTLTSAAGRIWKEDRTQTTGMATEWLIDVYGFLNYSQTGTVTPAHCIFGPFEVGTRGCQGCPGAHGIDRKIIVFYLAKSGLPPTAPGSATYDGTTISGVGSWRTTQPTLGANENLYSVYGYGVTTYDSTNTASYSVEWSCVFTIPRGCQGQRGCAGDCGSRGYVDVRYRRASVKPSTSGISFNTSGVFSYPSGWVENLEDTTGDETAWEVTVYGYIFYTGSTPSRATHSIFGPVPVGSQGERGCVGIPGTSTTGDIFYIRSALAPAKPSDPAPSSSGFTTAPPSGWYTSPSDACAAVSDGCLYYMQTCFTRTWSSSTSCCYYTCYEEPIAPPAGPTGEQGCCGTSLETIAVYRRHPQAQGVPPTTGVDYGSSGFSYPGWSRTIPTGTDPAWQITIYGYTNYTSTTTTYTHYISGPVPLGARGSAGAPGQHGTSVWAETYYIAAPAAPSAPSSTTWNGSSFSNVDTWTKSPPMPAENQKLYVATAYGYTMYDTSNTASYSVQWSCPYEVPSGCQGCEGVSSDVVWIYQRSASLPSAPVFNSGDPTTGTYDGTTFVPATGWSTSNPVGTNDLYIVAATLKSDNTIKYGCLISIPSTTSGSTQGCPVTYPDVLIDRTARLLDMAGNRLAPNAAVPPSSGIVQSRTVEISFLWSEAVRGFTTGDVRLLNFNCDNAAATLTWPSPRPTQGTTWTATLNLPADTSGEVEISVPVGAGESVRVAGAHGPQVERRLRIRYNTAGISSCAPVVDVNYNAYEGVVLFKWNEEVNDFTADDITFASTPTIAKGVLTKNADDATLYEMPISVPATATDLTVTIAQNAVTNDAGVSNAAHTETIRITPRTDATGVPAGTTLIWSVEQPFQSLDWLDSVLSRTPAGGAFMGVSDLTKIGNYLYGVAQIMHVQDANRTKLSTQTEAGGAIFRVNLSTNTGEVVKAYARYTQAARSLVEYQNQAYWFEGSGYNYVFGDGHAADDKVGRVIAHSPTSSGCTMDRGVNFRSKLGRETTSGFQDNYGIHGGTISPMRVRGDDLLLVSGYGNFQLINDPDSDAADTDNFVIVQYGQRIPLRMPVLQTNERTGWAIISEIARMTNSIIGFEGSRVVFRPRGIFTATLTGALSSTATTMSFEQGSRPLPPRGLILIDDELIEYTFNIV